MSAEDGSQDPRMKFLGGRIKIRDDNIDRNKIEGLTGPEFWISRPADSDGNADSWSLFGFNQKLTLSQSMKGKDYDNSANLHRVMFTEGDDGENSSHYHILIVNRGPTKGVVLDRENPGASDDFLFEESADTESGTHGRNPGSGKHDSNLGSSFRNITSHLDSLGIDGELATINIVSVSIFRIANENHMSDVTGNRNDPFVMVSDCHTDRDEINGLGYNGNLGGVVRGLGPEMRI
jgi:hypothetical protein